MPSRFLKEVPTDLCDIQNKASFYGYGIEKKYNTGYNAPKQTYNEGIFTSKTEKSTVKYKVGMNVEHKTFGEGVILSVREMGSDSLLEVNFASCGNKKLMANFAKLKII